MKYKIFGILTFLTLFLVSDILAKGYSSSRSSSSRSSSSSWSSSKSSGSSWKSSKPTSSKPKSSSWNSNKSKSSSFKKSDKVVTQSKSEKAVAKSKLDKKLNKKMATKDNAAAKKYGDKKSAEKAYREKLASSKPNKYTSATPPSTRPSHIPQNINTGGRSVNVTYNVLPGGGYGYGYIDPLTLAFVALAPRYYHVDPYAMRTAGYGNWDTSGRPIVYRETSTGLVFLYVILGIIGFFTIGFFIYKMST